MRNCPGCACVAYCSDRCRLADAACEHAHECGRTRGITLPDGDTVLAQQEVGFTRAATQASKPRSACMRIATGAVRCAGLTFGLTCQSSVQGRLGSIMIPMGYEIEQSGAAAHQCADALAAQVAAALRAQERAAPAPATPQRCCALPACSAPATAGVKLKLCGACNRAAYCCKEHQCEHWAQGHKQQCKEWRKAS